MAYPGDPAYPPTEPFVDRSAPAYPSTDPAYRADTPAYRAERYDERYERRGADRRPDLDREVTAGPFRFGLRHGILGIITLFAILGLALGVLGFSAAFALDAATEPGATNEDARNAVLPTLLVSVLPFLATPIMALAMGAWAGHASRDTSIGAISGVVGGLLGPLLMVLITGMGFALGAGAASLNIAAVEPSAFGVGPGWGDTVPYIFSGPGLLWMVANTLAGALAGALLGALLSGRWATRRHEARRTYSRTTRY